MNPSTLLYKKHAKNILAVRSKVFSSLEKTSPIMSLAVQKVLNSKLECSSKGKHPLMFELFPWILADLCDLNKKTCMKISVNWLAVYLHVIFIDDQLDLKKEIKAEEFIGTSFLAQKGLLNLFKIVNGTKYEKAFTDALMSSANFQLTDVLEQASVYTNDFAKADSASGKNRILLACAGAIAASNQKNAKFIIDLTKKLLLTVQLLDDLADFEEDYRHKNITILLNQTVKNIGFETSEISRQYLLEEIVVSGALLNIVNKIEESISTSLILINKKKITSLYKTPSYIFFNELYYEILNLQQFLEEKKDFKTIEKESDRKNILDKIDKSISKIYFHS